MLHDSKSVHFLCRLALKRDLAFTRGLSRRPSLQKPMTPKLCLSTCRILALELIRRFCASSAAERHDFPPQQGDVAHILRMESCQPRTEPPWKLPAPNRTGRRDLSSTENNRLVLRLGGARDVDGSDSFFRSGGTAIALSRQLSPLDLCCSYMFILHSLVTVLDE